MRGLLLKDYYCLKRKLFVWGVTIFATTAVCVMFMISTKTGNVAVLYEKIANSEDSMDAAIIPFLTRIVLILFLLLPVAASFDLMQYVFTDDKTASFYKVASSLPLSRHKRVGERYILLGIVIVGSFAIDAVLLALVKATSDLMPFWDSFQIVLAFGGVSLFCATIALVFGYRFGADAAIWGNLVGAVILIAAVIIRNLSFFKKLFSVEGDESAIHLLKGLTGAADFLEHKGVYVLLAALPVAGAGYLLSVWIMGRKRGVA